MIVGKCKGGKAAGLVCEFIQDNYRIEFLDAGRCPRCSRNT